VGCVVLAQLAFTYLPALQVLFRTEAVSLRDGLLVIGIGVLLLVVLEIEKWLFRRLRPRASG
uniref:cation transporting ATPase C-terminal domain-containing protein n=1 Tax=Vogesella mureinivorans TaxID=657276 RepID=UPI0011CC0A5F